MVEAAGDSAGDGDGAALGEGVGSAAIALRLIKPSSEDANLVPSIGYDYIVESDGNERWRSCGSASKLLFVIDMADERIEKIRSAVEAADHIPAEKKAELLRLIASLDPTIAKLAKTNDEHAQRIAGLVEASAHEAAGKNPERMRSVLGELRKSVRSFEASHPDLVSFVTEYSGFLSALGI